ncbi:MULTISPECIES: MATE family efflux transporter [unclassified Butyrivibrio]|uniref:MATE family efflux transporter n=1 Tax=unclassified Butyrivibrio TaxID=2639466 RepID=UPI0003B4A436|nr:MULTISPECIES: MATE family efflux transporter [unclassified Butyrivibrio]
MKSNITDMTTGNPARHILVFALPTLIGNIFQQIYNLADSIIVGRFVGADAFAAVGATSSITFLFFALCNGIGGGGGIVVSQYYGAHIDSKVKKCIVNTGLIMLLVPIFFGALGFLLAPHLLKLLGTPELIIGDAILYVRFMCIGLLFVSLYNYLSSMLRALGDSRTPLYFLIISTVINIVLDIVFVCVFRLGIKGAALATVVAQFISVVLSAIYAYKTNRYFRFEKEDFEISMHMTYKIIRLGVPMSIQFGLIAISAMAVQRIVNSYGTTVVAAFTATNRIEQLIHQPYATLGASLATYSGQNFGAKRNDRVYSGYKSGLVIMAVFTAILVFTMQLFGRAICSMFVTDTEVITLGADGLKITSLFYLALGLIYVVRGVLTGIGDAFFSLFNGVIEVIGRFTIPLLLTSYLGFGATGIWLSSGIVWLISGVTAWLRYYTYFQRKRLHTHASIQTT